MPTLRVSLHFFKTLGPAIAFDMISTERKHQEIKRIFGSTSKRFGSANEEMLAKYITFNMISNAWDRLKDLEIDKIKKVQQNMYYTPENISFESPLGTSYRKKFTYLTKKGTFGLKGPDNSFVNPILDEIFLNNIIMNYIRFTKEEKTIVSGT